MSKHLNNTHPPEPTTKSIHDFQIPEHSLLQGCFRTKRNIFLKTLQNTRKHFQKGKKQRQSGCIRSAVCL